MGEIVRGKTPLSVTPGNSKVTPFKIVGPIVLPLTLDLGRGHVTEGKGATLDLHSWKMNLGHSISNFLYAGMK